MGGVLSVLSSLPPWMGSLPAWTTLLVIVAYIAKQWLKNQPVINEQRIQERAAIKTGYIERIQTLETKVEECERRCDEREEVLQRKIEGLNETIFGLRRQHVQEQISFINAICGVVDAPQLQILKRALEAGERALRQEKSSGESPETT